jgi:hypothetical protein
VGDVVGAGVAFPALPIATGKRGVPPAAEPVWKAAAKTLVS